jgi:hypothetical protein
MHTTLALSHLRLGSAARGRTIRSLIRIREKPLRTAIRRVRTVSTRARSSSASSRSSHGVCNTGSRPPIQATPSISRTVTDVEFRKTSQVAARTSYGERAGWMGSSQAGIISELPINFGQSSRPSLGSQRRPGQIGKRHERRRHAVGRNGWTSLVSSWARQDSSRSCCGR